MYSADVVYVWSAFDHLFKFVNSVEDILAYVRSTYPVDVIVLRSFLDEAVHAGHQLLNFCDILIVLLVMGSNQTLKFALQSKLQLFNTFPNHFFDLAINVLIFTLSQACSRRNVWKLPIFSQ